MNYNTFQKRVDNNIYNPNDSFWVCDVRQSSDNPIKQFYRKLKPIKVVYLGFVDGNHHFVKACKSGKPSKTKVSVYGPTLYQEPFQIFETEYECQEYYEKALKRVFIDINNRFDAFKGECKEALGDILEELSSLSV